jgi:RNA polymerase sigma-70 factor, ECF subfamily
MCRLRKAASRPTILKEIVPRVDYWHRDWALTLALVHMTRQETFEQIVREQDVMIKRIASSYEARAHLLEELVQEIYFAIWRALPSFRGDSSFRTFVARIATNRGATHVANALRFPPYLGLSEDIAAPDDNPESQAIALDRGARLTSAVRSLPLAYRQTASLTLEGLTPTEIADVLGITTNAVAIRMSRARALLEEIMGESP